MKVVFTGGGTGGHFYPLIAVAQALDNEAREEKLASLEMYYFSDTPYDKQTLFEQGIIFVRVPAGKMRMYASWKNLFDIFKVVYGILVATVKLFSVYPDVVFGKGGYASFPTLVAARFLRIPYIIHESDVVPGRVNKRVGKKAKHIAVSFAEAGTYFPEEKVAHTGQPMRVELMQTRTEGANEYLKLNPELPTVLVVGGSLGAKRINETMLEVLPDMLKKYQVIHQVGGNNYEDMLLQSESILKDHPDKERYRLYDFLNPLALSMAGGVADVIISRAGSMLFEFAAWGVPTILIPITNSHGDHQRQNAYTYARSGGASVIEEKNLGPHLLLSEVDRIVEGKDVHARMVEGAQSFHKPDASQKIARALVHIGLAHEGKVQ